MSGSKSKKACLKADSHRIAIFQAFLKGEAKGGAELLMFQLRDFLKADFWVSSYDYQGFKDFPGNQDPFVRKLHDYPGGFKYWHLESKIPIWRYLKRYINFLLNPKIRKLKKYKTVIFQGNNFFVQRRLRKIAPNVRQVVYVNTPPRSFTDQFETKIQKFPKIFYPLFGLFRQLVLSQYRADLLKADYIIANSENIKSRLKKYLNIEADAIVYPVLDISKYKFLGQKDYFLSYSRLEPEKRIELIVKAFQEMPDKQLIICSSGPLKNWLEKYLLQNQIKNITYLGRVSDKKLQELVGFCLVGIFIPKNEDAGMIQLELMKAGKPVIGVADGGLLETVLDRKTGILLPKDVTKEDLKKAVRMFTAKKALSYKPFCLKEAEKYSGTNFCKQIQKIL